MSNEFEEVGHPGGNITFILTTTPEGCRTYQIQYMGSFSGPVKLIELWALPQGIPVTDEMVQGRNIEEGRAPIPGAYRVILASDSQGWFGHRCPKCAGYWRSGPWPNVCPYCASVRETFLSDAQRRYITEYCGRLFDGLNSATDGDVTIDLDAVADAVGKIGEKPAFYLSEQSQQQKFRCTACGEFNDILGVFGYCSGCGTRNDLALFRDTLIPAIRERINADQPPEDCVRDAVARFDTLVAQSAKQLAEHVPLTRRCEARIVNRRFHNLNEVQQALVDCFDIDLRDGISNDDWAFTVRMFHRRHVYEHNGGEVDQKYLDDSGDTSVVLKQRIRETKESAHRLLGVLARMARNVHEGLHELFPPVTERITAFEERKAREAQQIALRQE